jgi:hypothetical protein
MQERKWEYIETIHQLFIDLKQAYDSLRRKVFTIFSWSLGYP